MHRAGVEVERAGAEGLGVREGRRTGEGAVEALVGDLGRGSLVGAVVEGEALEASGVRRLLTLEHLRSGLGTWR